MNKRADITDTIIFVIVLSILAVGFFVFAYVVPTIATGLLDANLNSTSEGHSAIASLSTFGTSTIQRGFFLLFVGLIMGVLISAFFIRTHPIFIFLYVIFTGIAVLVSIYMGNMYNDLTTQPLFAERLADQTFINLVMSNIAMFTLGVGVLSIVIIFSKFSFGGSTRL